MPVSVNVQTVRARKLAAVRREVPPGAVGSAWGPALDSRHYVSVYRAVLREELTALLRQAGFVEVRWLMPAESNSYQPALLGLRPSVPSGS